MSTTGFSKHFITDKMPQNREVTYRCAGCGKVFNQLVPCRDNPCRMEPPEGMKEIGVTLWNDVTNQETQEAMSAPVCDDDECAKLGMRAVVEILLNC
jgi:hypothetical protein